MRKITILATAAFFFGGALLSAHDFDPLSFFEISTRKSIPQQYGDIKACFTPEMDCAAFVVGFIRTAPKHTLTVAAYNFTEPRIIAAIVAAAQRGIEVTVKLDKISPCQKGSGADAMIAAGINTYVDQHVRIAHDKVIVADGQSGLGSVTFGSFNFSDRANDNAEDVVLVTRPQVAKAFEDHILERIKRSVPYTHKAEFCKTGVDNPG